MDQNDFENHDKQPWWNDGDKMGGLFATSVAIMVLAIAFALIFKLCIWLITGEWTL